MCQRARGRAQSYELEISFSIISINAPFGHLTPRARCRRAVTLCADWLGLCEINETVGRWQLIKNDTLRMRPRGDCIHARVFEDERFSQHSLPSRFPVSISSQLGVSFSPDLEYKLNISSLHRWKVHLKLVSTTQPPPSSSSSSSSSSCLSYHHLSLLCSCEDTEAPGALKCLHTLEIESNGINQDTLFSSPPLSLLLPLPFLFFFFFFLSVFGVSKQSASVYKQHH